MSMGLSDHLARALNGTRRRAGLPHNRGILPFSRSPIDLAPSEQPSGDLSRIFFKEADGVLKHKWLHYLRVYEENLSSYRGTAVRLLEIGVSKGGSLEMWRTYFGEKAVIFGIDINPACARFDGQHGNVRIGSQDDPNFLANVVDEMGGLDVVIDDGSHIMSHINKTFDCLFDKIADDGLYIAEDLHSAYWRGVYEGGYRRKTSFIERVKRIVDDLHADYHQKGCGDVADAHRCIHSVKFYNSMVVIQKSRQAVPAHVGIGHCDL